MGTVAARRAGVVAHAAPTGARRLDGAWWSVVSPLVLLGAWWWTTSSALFPPTLLSSPMEVWDAACELARSGELGEHLRVSLVRLFGGFAAGGSLGIAFGVLIARSPLMEALMAPLFQVLRQLPTVALIPMFVLIFGIGETFKVFIVMKACFFILGLSTYDAVRALPAAHLEVAALYRLPAWTTFRRILFPATVPSVLTGARLALGRSWLVLVGAELLAAESGLGQMMEMARQIFRMDIVLVGVLLTGLIGFGLDRGFLLLQRVLVRWRTA